MTEFLDKLHKEFGPIASFWIEKEFIVSIASPELFKEVSHIFDRPGNSMMAEVTLLTTC